MAGAQTFTLSSHNMLFSLDPKRWNQDLTKSDMGDITAYQEANGRQMRTTLKNFCGDHGRGLYHPDSTGQPISWKVKRFEPMANTMGVVEVHRGAKGMGVDAHMKPARDFSHIGLREKESGSQGLVINVHPISTATADESQINHNQGTEVNIWNDWSIGQYWLDVVSFSAKAMSHQRPGKETRESKWDWICLIGDFNADLRNKEMWYYPGNLVLSLFDTDKRPQGLDHIIFSKGSDLRKGERRVAQGHTDHLIHFQTVTTTAEQPDFPRDR
jgi:hypothetical protein